MLSTNNISPVNTNWKSTIIQWNNWHLHDWLSRRTRLLALELCYIQCIVNLVIYKLWAQQKSKLEWLAPCELLLLILFFLTKAGGILRHSSPFCAFIATSTLPNITSAQATTVVMYLHLWGLLIRAVLLSAPEYQIYSGYDY